MKNSPVASVSLLLTRCCPPMLYTSCPPPSLRAASLHLSLPIPQSPLPIHQPVPWANIAQSLMSAHRTDHSLSKSCSTVSLVKND
ncbi:hypothetical protein AAHC03_016900 [Spirometra sp. Aus1]